MKVFNNLLLITLAHLFCKVISFRPAIHLLQSAATRNTERNLKMTVVSEDNIPRVDLNVDVRKWYENKFKTPVDVVNFIDA